MDFGIIFGLKKLEKQIFIVFQELIVSDDQLVDHVFYFLISMFQLSIIQLKIVNVFYFGKLLFGKLHVFFVSLDQRQKIELIFTEKLMVKTDFVVLPLFLFESI